MLALEQEGSMPDENIVSDQSDNRGHPDKEPPWRLNVQGVKVESDEPRIVVRRCGGF